MYFTARAAGKTKKPRRAASLFNDFSQKLTFGELLVRARASEPDLLALDHAGIAREETGLFEDGAHIGVHLEQSARHSEADRAGLTGKAAAVSVDEDVYLAFDSRRRQRLSGLRGPEVAREVVLHFAVVDEELA